MDSLCCGGSRLEGDLEDDDPASFLYVDDWGWSVSLCCWGCFGRELTNGKWNPCPNDPSLWLLLNCPGCAFPSATSCKCLIYICLKLLIIAIDFDNRSNVFINATISILLNFKFGWFIDPSSSKRIFKAVPYPIVCIFPHILHLSQPTQSIMAEMFLKRARNSCFKLGSFVGSNKVDVLNNVFDPKAGMISCNNNSS